MITVYKKWLYLNDGDCLVLDNKILATVTDTEALGQGQVRIHCRLGNGQFMFFETVQESLMAVQIPLHPRPSVKL